MRQLSLTGSVLGFLLVLGLLLWSSGCGDSEPKKVDENPFKARQEAQKEKGGLMPRGVKTNK